MTEPRTPAHADDGFPLTVAHEVAWGEMDALGHVNNARFFTWFESARIALFRAIGVVTERGGSCGPILATTTCDFRMPVTFPASLRIGVRVSSVGNTSMTLQYVVRGSDPPGAVYATGSSVVVMVDYRTMEKVPVPDAVRAAVLALEKTPAR